MMVSIIIPVYNVEKYLPRCIESVLSQTYSSIEIILVDDGSVDNSGKICDEIASVNPKVKVIHKENGGLSSARNTGIDIAKGEAIFFLDSDDYLSHDCIEKCVQIMDKTNSDISIIQMMYISEETNDEIEEVICYEEELLSTSEAIEASLYQIKFSCCAPAKLYRRTVIGNVRFPVGRLSEDLATCHLFLNNADKIAYINKIGYYYRQHSDSIMHTFNIKRMDALVWAKEILNFCKVNYPEIEKAALCRIFNVSIHLVLEIPDNEYEEQKNILWNEIIKTRVQVLIDKKSRKREKIASIISFFGYRVLKKVWKSRFAIKRKEFK
ncbi:MAG: glycosyltransferase [Lachnospiraceae bacterium]|jgi:Glycosyltransferases involved in cell wall biogenesis